MGANMKLNERTGEEDRKKLGREEARSMQSYTQAPGKEGYLWTAVDSEPEGVCVLGGGGGGVGGRENPDFCVRGTPKREKARKGGGWGGAGDIISNQR